MGPHELVFYVFLNEGYLLDNGALKGHKNLINKSRVPILGGLICYDITNPRDICLDIGRSKYFVAVLKVCF
jgi:hypothetical protein